MIEKSCEQSESEPPETGGLPGIDISDVEFLVPEDEPYVVHDFDLVLLEIDDFLIEDVVAEEDYILGRFRLIGFNVPDCDLDSPCL